MSKPDPAIYKYTLDKLEVNAEDAIFLDDLGHNLKAAKALGLRTIKVSIHNIGRTLDKLFSVLSNSRVSC